jgi:hypothetical protein
MRCSPLLSSSEEEGYAQQGCKQGQRQVSQRTIARENERRFLFGDLRHMGKRLFLSSLVNGDAKNRHHRTLRQTQANLLINVDLNNKSMLRLFRSHLQKSKATEIRQLRMFSRPMSCSIRRWITRK